MDIVRPDGNEQDLLDMAKTLGISELCLLYPYSTDVVKLRKHLALLKGVYRIGIEVPYSIKPKEINKLGDVVRVCKADAHARHAIEKKVAHIMYGFEDVERKDSVHFPRSGINQVEAKLMAKNGVVYGVSLQRIIECIAKRDPRVIGRIMHNLMLQRKFKFPAMIGSFASKPLDMRQVKDLQSLLVVLSAEEKQARSMAGFSLL